MMWRRSLSRPGWRACPSFRPLLARLPALPGARREAEDLDGDAADAPACGQDVGAGGGAVIGRPRMEPELSSTRVTTVSRKFGVALLLEGKRLHWVDDQPRQARRI